MSTTIIRRDYKWGEKDWRGQPAETFQMSKRVTTRFTVVDGQVVATTETTEGFANPIAGVPGDSTSGPPWLWADKTYREFPISVFQMTGVKYTQYETFSETSYEATIDAFDAETGKFDQRVKVHIDGQIPLAPNIGSGVARMVSRALTAQLVVDPSDFADAKTKLQLQWAEDTQDMETAGIRAMQRAYAAQRTVSMRANPLMLVGDTVRVVNPQRGVDASHMLVGVRTNPSAQGIVGQDQDVEVEWWPVPGP